MANLACFFAGKNCPKPPENRIEILNEIISNVIFKKLKVCENDINFSQVVSMTCNPSSEVEIARANSPACLEQTRQMAASGDFRPAPICYSCVQSEIDQGLVSSFNQECHNKALNMNELRADISQNLMQQAKKEVSDFGGVFEQATANNLLEASNKVANSFTSENMTKVLTKLSSNQEVTFQGSGGLQNAISQNAAHTLISKSLTEDQNYNKELRKFSNELDQSLDLSQRGIIGALGDFVNSLFSGLGNFVNSIFSGLSKFWFVIIGLVVFAIVSVSLLRMYSNNQSKE